MTITNLRAFRTTLDTQLVKASCFGNNFLIYDGTDEPTLDEINMAEFSRQATDPLFGLGADNFLVIQNCSPIELAEINQVNQYWKKIPACSSDYIFRMFEPNGDEALCCGNGLMCIANYMSEKYQIENLSIMTEVPLAQVKRTTIGFSPRKSYGWVNLGGPRKMPNEIRVVDASDDFSGEIQTLHNLVVKFRHHDLEPYSTALEMALSGHLVFTGEPHLVFLLDDEESPIAELAEAIFADSNNDPGTAPMFQRRRGFGTWLVDHIGHYLNSHYQDRFPAGINVNFVRLNPNSGTIEYRCYERGIFKETLACGTGAVASAFVVKYFLGYEGRSVKVFPHRCRWYKPEAVMAVNNSDHGWVLEGQPDIVADIEFRFEPTLDTLAYHPRQLA